MTAYPADKDLRFTLGIGTAQTTAVLKMCPLTTDPPEFDRVGTREHIMENDTDNTKSLL